MLQVDRTRSRPGGFFWILAVAMVLIAGVGCARDAPITIASHVRVGYEPMFLARSLGWLDEGRVTLHETASASESMEALVAGRVDGAAREPPARRSAALDHLVAEHLPALEYFHRHPCDAAIRMGLRLELPAHEVQPAFRGLLHGSDNLKVLFTDRYLPPPER